MATPAKRQKPGNADAEEVAIEKTSLRGTFAKDLATMMYAFGDDENPLPETIDLVEDIVIEYATGVLKKSLDIASLRGKTRPTLKGIGSVAAEDIMAVVRRDPKKFERVRELFDLQVELNKARAGFEDPAGLADTDALKSLAKDLDDTTGTTT